MRANASTPITPEPKDQLRASTPVGELERRRDAAVGLGEEDLPRLLLLLLLPELPRLIHQKLNAPPAASDVALKERNPVDLSAPPGTDPSHPAFLITNQSIVPTQHCERA